MDILHVTDLHLTEPNDSLDELWTTVVDQLGDRTFDFIVVSGDLTQSAQWSQYKHLHAFCIGQLKQRLPKGGWPRRIVFVPGNHDVQWEHSIGRRIPHGRSSKVLASELKAFRRQPERSDVRAFIDDQGTAQVVRIDRARYHRRFGNAQRFLDLVYGSALRGSSRKFVLGQDERDHWSAHVFPSERIAFYGFNSCHSNDKMWTGAYISRRAVFEAAAHARRHAAGCLCIAVWHHGLATDRGRPDYLTLQDVGFLYHNGFRVGFHGHTHSDEFGDLEQWLGKRFPIVATGSLGAGPAERPGGLHNQFAIVRITPAELVVERFRRDDARTGWRSTTEPPYLLHEIGVSSGINLGSVAEEHRRSFVVDEHTGICDITVELKQLMLDGQLILATPSKTYSNIHFDQYARTDRGSLPIHLKEGSDGRMIFSVSGSSFKYRSLSWGYSISNSFATSKSDLRFRIRAPEWDTLIGSDRDGIAHRVHFRCERLALEIRSKRRTSIFDAAGPLFRVLRTDGADTNTLGAGEEPEEMERSLPSLRASGSRVSISINGPMLGLRYLLAWRPRQEGNALTPAAAMLSTTVVERLRSMTSSGSIDPITDALDKGIRWALGLKRSSDLTWYGYLWHQTEKQLMAGFGRFPRYTGGLGFAHGRGIVGHAFRFGTVSAYCSGPRPTLIFQPPVQSPLSTTKPFEWIVCIPILLNPTGPAIGVVGFAGRESRGWDEDLRAYARRVGGPSVGKSEHLLEFENRLVAAVSIPFWNALPSLPGLSQFDIEEAIKVIEDFQRIAR